MVRIKDIADKAGVSRGTVDRVLHGRSGVNLHTVRKIRQVIEELGYKANPAGVMLAAVKRPTKIGCLLPSVGNPFFVDIVSGLSAAEKELAGSGLTVVVKNVRGFDEPLHLGAIEELVCEGCNALLLATINSPALVKRINALVLSGIPVGCVNTDVPLSQRLFYVGTDYYKSGMTSAGMLALMDKNRQSTLIFTGSFNIFGHNERIRGFLDGLEQHGVRCDVLAKDEVMDDNDIAYEKGLRLFSRHPDVTSVLITAGGVSGVCHALLDSHLESKPRVLSFDDIPETIALLKAGVIDATITQEPFNQGYYGVKRMFDAILSNFNGENMSVILPPSLFIKENIRDA